MDNGLEDDEVVDKAFDLFVDGEMSEKAAKELGIEVTDSGNASCPEDDCDGTLQPSDDCAVCDVCFFSPCS
jgi:hypothetical protein